MNDDERSIREVVANWIAASKAGDTAKVLELMSDDVVFMVPGQEPFGKEAFAAASSKQRGTLVDGSSEIVEIKVLGDWAWLRNRLRVVVTSPDGQTTALSGYTLTILRKQADGRWVLTRDANLLMPEAR